MSQLLFPHLLPYASQADSFNDFPHSIMSVGKPVMMVPFPFFHRREVLSTKNRMSYSLARVNQYSSGYVTTMATTTFCSSNTKVTAT
jgi:hypothetical protein